jgi:hypothetical protein
MCNDCTDIFVKSEFNSLEISYPPKCWHCSAFVHKESFDAHLSAPQKSQFELHAVIQKITPGQDLIECAECSCIEILPTGEERFTIWWCKECFNGKCLVCLKSVPKNERKSLEIHSACKRLGRVKALIEDALELGSKQPCPGCGLSGRKDEACNHMTCPKCGEEWCYVCGKDATKFENDGMEDEDEYGDDIFGSHFEEWKTNDSCCPSSFSEICGIDCRWPTEENTCLEYFHRFQSIKQLQEVQASVGSEEFILAFETFDSIKNAGYTLKEVVDTDTSVLIARSDHISKNNAHNTL